MTTLEAAIAPREYEVAVVVPSDAQMRHWFIDKAEALETARRWCSHRWSQVTITAFGDGAAFALKHINWIDSTHTIETNWRTWGPDGIFLEDGTD